MAFRYNITMNDNLPAGLVACYTRGAIVNGDQADTNTVTVHETHDFQIGHKFLYALTRSNIQTNRVFTITAKAATTVTFSGAAIAFSDGTHLVPLGTDTGGVLQTDGTYSPLNWDGSPIQTFSDPNEDDAYTNATVPVEPGGELGFWTEEADLWAVSRQLGGKPVRVYILSSVTGSGGQAVASDTIWDAKGDLAVGTGPDAADNLPVGTNGQILQADSGETLGIKWATPGIVVRDSIWDAKGDLAVGTAADTAAKLAVGTNGYVLTADSGETTGVKWAAASSGVASDDRDIHIAVSVFH